MEQKVSLKEVSPDDVSQTLESASKMSQRYHINASVLRPCVGKLMDTPLFRGSFPNRNEAALIIASECRRVGKDEQQTLDVVRDWNSRNLEPLRESETQKAVRNAFWKEYNYSCLHASLQGFCIGESCPFEMSQKAKHGKYFTNLDFVRYGWPRLLPNSAVLVYYVALPLLEKLMGVGPGGQVIASQRRIADAAGICPKSVRGALKKLVEAGLITYEPGVPRQWEGKASKIRRIIPIPKPGKHPLAKREK